MANHAPDIIILLIIVVSVGILYIINKSVSSANFIQNPSVEYSWMVHGLLNVLGYSTVFLPGYLVFKYIRKINYLTKIGKRPFTSILNRCFLEEELVTTVTAPPPERSQLQDFFLLAYYFVGLQGSYLTWGVLQEKVVTQPYENADGEVGHFKNFQFLVFINRILAFSMTGLILMCRRQPRHKCPLYKYSFCSFSNVMSSWCQFEALKYVSFPHQVLAKAAKTIPVMIMGKIVSRTKYEYYEYVTAVILSIGMLLFMLDTDNDRSHSTATTVSGAVLLVSYIAFDSFTSNWQGKLFKNYHMKPIQMMCCVNLYSCIFTAVSLFQQEDFSDSFNFMMKYPRFSLDCILLSIVSAIGQIFIYSTLSTFGPLIFAIISTIRQGFSVFLSCIIYNHKINVLGIFGVILVFIGILLRSYCSHRLQTIRKNQSSGLKPQRI